MSRFSFIIFLLFFLTNLFAFFSKSVSAENFFSTNFKIDFGNLNLTGGNKTSSNYNLTDTVGQNAPGQYNSSSYTVKAGFQYIYDLLQPFSFTISDIDIPFGSLEPGVGTTQTNTLSITTPYGLGYDILAVENHPLWNQYEQAIPDVTCDANNCSESVSGDWALPTTYGFGFNAWGIGSTGIFTSQTKYRQFANANANEQPQLIATETVSVKDRENIITYKINISPNQAAGSYQNGIIYIAVPKY